MESKVIELFRQDFFSARRAKISKFGVMTFDESSLLCALGENAQPVVVSDLFPAERAHGKIEHYLLGLEHLWTARCHQTQEKHPRTTYRTLCALSTAQWFRLCGRISGQQPKTNDGLACR